MTLLVLIRFGHFWSRSENPSAIWNLNMGFDGWYKNNRTRKKNLIKILQTHREISSSFLGYFIRKSLFFDYLNSGSEFSFHLKYNLCSRTMLIQIINNFHVKTSSVFHRPSPTWPYFHTFVLKSKIRYVQFLHYVAFIQPQYIPIKPVNEPPDAKLPIFITPFSILLRFAQLDRAK